MEPCRYERQGSVFGNHSTGEPNRAGSNLPRDHCRCPVPACDDAWRWFTAKRFCGNGFASVGAAKRFSSCARTVTAAIATAVPNAANKPAASSDGTPAGATTGVPKDGSIIAIASRRIAADCVKRNRA